MKKLPILGAVLTAALAGCGSSRSSSTPPNSSSAAAPRPSATGSRSAAAALPDHLAGFGATVAAWSSAHQEDGQFAPGSVYNEDPSLPDINGNTGADYTEVQPQDGRILAYDLHFRNVPIREAKAIILSNELPPDTQVLWFSVKDTCAFWLLRSRTLGRALGTEPIGDGAGIVSVEFGSGVSEDYYDSRSVSDALFSLSEYTTPANAPGC